MPFDGETQYQFRVRVPQIFERERTQTTALEARKDGALGAPSSGTYTLYSPTRAVVASGAVTVTGSVATRSVTASELASTLSFGENYREVWALVMPDGATYTATRAACLARYELRCPVSQADLTQTDKSLIANLGAFATSLQDYIDDSWAAVLRRLFADGRWPDTVVSVSSLVDPVREHTRYLIYRELFTATQAGERFERLMSTAWERWEASWGRVSFRVDNDQDGAADSLDRHAAGRVIHRNGAPTYNRGTRFNRPYWA